jgi:hypothetical protein
MDTDSSTISPWDIRSGVTLGGIPGKMAFYDNHANLDRYDRTSGSGSILGLDIYDSVHDEFNNQDDGDYSETDVKVIGEDIPNRVHPPVDLWYRDPASDNGAGALASNGECDSGEECVFVDRLTTIGWAQYNYDQMMSEGSSSFFKDFEGAALDCKSKNTNSFGGYSSGWRLPSIKELQQAYINGVWHLRRSNYQLNKLNLYDTQTKAG